MASVRLLPARFIRSRARAHRAMARAALFSDSSSSVRLRRYNDHMAKARRLEASLADHRPMLVDVCPTSARSPLAVQEGAQ